MARPEDYPIKEEHKRSSFTENYQHDLLNAIIGLPIAPQAAGVDSSGEGDSKNEPFIADDLFVFCRRKVSLYENRPASSKRMPVWFVKYFRNHATVEWDAFRKMNTRQTEPSIIEAGLSVVASYTRTSLLKLMDEIFDYCYEHENKYIESLNNKKNEILNLKKLLKNLTNRNKTTPATIVAQELRPREISKENIKALEGIPEDLIDEFLLPSPVFGNTYQLYLELPARREGNINYYGTQLIDVIGRSEEQAQLKEFLNPNKERNFLWFQLAGVAGQGKSRLALDLVQESGTDWHAGFVPEHNTKFHDFVDSLKDWLPNKPHLLVMDYVIGRDTEKLQTFFWRLIQRQHLYQHPVRLLLLERQPWNRGFGLQAEPNRTSDEGFSVSTTDYTQAQWFMNLTGSDGYVGDVEEAKFRSGMLELKKLEESALLDIVNYVANIIPGNKLDLQKDDERVRIIKKLQHIDKEGRPLYAYFLAQEEAAGSDTQNWSKSDLLTATLNRERAKRWSAQFDGKPPDSGSKSLAMRIALLATMTGEFNCLEAETKYAHPYADNQVRLEAMVLAGNPIGPDDFNGPPETITAMQPDLLGEWFVISCLKKGRISVQETSDTAWHINDEAMSGFLQRLSQDFWGEPEINDLLDCIDFEKIEPETLTVIANVLLVHFHQNKNKIPQKIIFALEMEANNGKVRAMFNLGWCYQNGVGVEQSAEQAVKWYQKAADLNNTDAMFKLGVRYQNGEGVEQSAERAFEWYQKAADLDDALAMVNLGACYENGVGVEQSAKQAVKWYEKAADLNCAHAMVNLGVCYENGEGVEQSAERAFEWYQKAADLDDAGAMVNLGWCYENGECVEQSAEQAVKWYRKAADLDDADAMHILGVCYEDSIGVDRSLMKSVEWYWKAARLGHADAKEQLRLLAFVVTYFLSNDQMQVTDHADWTQKQVQHIQTSEWSDKVLLNINTWRPASNEETYQVCQSLPIALEIFGVVKILDNHICHRIRVTHLDFYPDCQLVDIELINTENQKSLFCSAIYKNGRIAPLPVTKNILNIVNQSLLNLQDRSNAAIDYLKFYCEFVRGEYRPFHILTDLADINFAVKHGNLISEPVKAAFFSPELVEDCLETGGYFRVKACTLYSNALFKTTFKLHQSGQVHMEHRELICSDLPILRRSYKGIFRTALHD